MTIAWMLALFFVLMGLGMPIGFCLGLAAIAKVLFDGQVPVLILAQQVYEALDNFSLLAIPLFVLAGELMGVAGITERLVNLSRALIGHFRGGLAQANILTNMFMGAISGSALADLTAISSGAGKIAMVFLGNFKSAHGNSIFIKLSESISKRLV